MDINTFRATYPEFIEVVPSLVQAMLDRATRWVDPAVWRAKTDDAIGLWAAHWLALSPMGSGTRLVQEDGTTTYQKLLEELIPAVTGGFLVAGGARGCR